MDQLNFGNSAALLRANGYVPAACSESGKPIGPWAIRQHAFDKYPENDPLPVAVLTAAPAPRSEFDPVQNPKATWLALLCVKVRDELAADVAALTAKYVGTAKCPVRIGDDALLYVFRTGELFGRVQTSPGHQPDHAAVEAGPSFIPLNGNWRAGLDLLDVKRAELPELDHVKAEALIGEINAILCERAPPVEPPAPRVPRPLLEPGQKLLWGNWRAMDALRENGFSLLPIRWGQQTPERNGYADFAGNWHYNDPLDQHGVGLTLAGLATVEIITRFRHDVDAAIQAVGPCLIRTVSGDETRRLYVFRNSSSGADQAIYSPNVHAIVRRRGVVVLSGVDEDGRQYEWNRDMLTARVEELAALESFDAQRLQRALERLPPVDYINAVPKRRKVSA
jgi:hypothetical protein